MKLGFFTSFNCGISLWGRLGTFRREMALYRRLANMGVEVHVFTLERARDVARYLDGEADKGLRVHALYPGWLPYNRMFALLLLPFLLMAATGVGRGMDVLKTNQGHAGIHVWLAATLWRKPYIARSGYVLSEQVTRRKDRAPLKDYVMCLLERFTMSRAAMCFLPSSALIAWCGEHMRCRQMRLLPNCVDTQLFAPTEDVTGDYVLSVSRIVAMKRHDLLLRACARAGMKLVVVGDGPAAEGLRKLAAEIGGELELPGRVANERLPEFYRNAKIFVLCSEYEGNPKSLIEAMSCGCACIGTRSPGIENQMVDGRNGLLVEGDVEALATAIKRISGDNGLAVKLRAGAREYAEENFALESLAKRELGYLREVVG